MQTPTLSLGSQLELFPKTTKQWQSVPAKNKGRLLRGRRGAPIRRAPLPSTPVTLSNRNRAAEATIVDLLSALFLWRNSLNKCVSKRALTTLEFFITHCKRNPGHDRYLQCWHRLDRIADCLNVSPDTVGRALKELKRLGLIKGCRERLPNGKFGHRYYWVLCPPDLRQFATKFKASPKPQFTVNSTQNFSDSPKPQFTVDSAPLPKPQFTVDSAGPHSNKDFNKENIYADANGFERSNIQRIRQLDAERTAGRIKVIRERLTKLGINSGTQIYRRCLNTEYLDYIEPIVQNPHFSKALIIEKIEYLNPPYKRSRLIKNCLDALVEKNCFVTEAIQSVFWRPSKAWHIIGSCDWSRTTGQQLAKMLTA